MNLDDYESYKRSAKYHDINNRDQSVPKNASSYGDLPDQVPENKFRFPVEVLIETEKAYKLFIDNDVEHWIPKGHAALGWSAGVTANDAPIFCADLSAWIVDNKNLLK